VTSDDIDFMLFGPRTCTTCGAVYPANTEHFGRDATRSDGLKSSCKACVSKAGEAAYRRKCGTTSPVRGTMATTEGARGISRRPRGLHLDGGEARG
jgi:hypothetical protein